ncbi:MAG: hypothetical protein ACXVCG_02245 [Bdellovibrionota bacterium]
MKGIRPMRATPKFLLAIAALALPGTASAAMSCKKQDGNLCYRIDGVQRSRIDRSQSFQKALGAVAQKMQGKSVVYIVQGYRTAAEQQRLVDQHCGGRSSCAGYASARTSRHVISIAADPMLYGNQIKSVCYAENQARVEFLGPRSAAAVYGYDAHTNLTWAHIDDSTNSNYTPRNCGRNEGLNGSERVAQGSAASAPLADSGAPQSQKVSVYRARQSQRQHVQLTSSPSYRTPASADPLSRLLRWFAQHGNTR